MKQYEVRVFMGGQESPGVFVFADCYSEAVEVAKREGKITLPTEETATVAVINTDDVAMQFTVSQAV